MKRILILMPLLTMVISSGAQNDPAAIRILDRFSENALAAPSVSMKFNAVTVDQLEGYTDTVPGTIILSRDKYRLELTDNIIWFNGETLWNYLPAEKEVTISKPEGDDDSFLSRPSSIFTLYREGYRSRLLEESASLYVIDLYPEDTRSELIRIRLTLSKPSLNIRELEYKNRNGLTITLNVKEYDLRQKPDPSVFTFQSSKYRGVEIIDMR